MAEEPLSWLFELYDKLSPPVNNMAAALEQFHQQLKATETPVDKLQSKTDTASKGTDKLRSSTEKATKAQKDHAESINHVQNALQKLDHIAEMSMASAVTDIFGAGQAITESVVGAVERAIDAVRDLGMEMIHSAGEVEQLGVALDLMVGKERAGQINEYIAGIAKYMQFDDDELLRAVLPMLESGVGKDMKSLQRAVTAALDVSAMRPGSGVGGFAEAASAFQRIQMSGNVDTRVLRSLALNSEDYFKRLGEVLKVSAETAEKRAQEGKVKADTLLSVVYASIAAKEGGLLGTGAERITNTVETKLKKLRDVPGNYFEALADSPAFAKFSGVLDRMLERLDPEGPSGKRIIAALERFLERFVEVLDRLSSPEGIDTLIDGLERAVEVLKMIASLFGVIVDSAVQAGVNYRVMTNQATDRDKFISMRARLGREASTYGMEGGEAAARIRARDMGISPELYMQAASKRGNMAEFSKFINALGPAAFGFAEGAKGAEAAAEKAGANLGAAHEKGLTNKLEIRSPSRVFARLGAQAAAGFAEGLTDGIETPTPAAPSLRARAGLGAGVSVQFGNITIEVDARGASSADEVVAELRDKIRPELRAIVLAAFEGIGAEQGVDE